MKNLKKYSSPVVIIFMMILFSSCKNEPILEPEITLAKEEIGFDKESGTSMLAIKTNVAWTATSSQSWCTLSPTNGEAGTKQITVAVTENITNAAREASISITAGSLTKQVKVTQELTNTLTIVQKEYNLEAAATEIIVNIEAVLPYTSAIQSDWITLKSTSADNKTITFSIAENLSTVSREGTVTFTSGTLSETITVRQAAKTISIPADNTGMGSDALVLAKKMNIGWNIGNSLEATGSETAWGNPKITKTLIDAVKAAGFNAVRIPCAWDSYIENQTTYKIKDSWLARVKEVVNYCVDNNMYVILNIHWDGGWLEENPTYAKQAEVNAKQKALWEQIAVYFRNYDERLLFAGTNEVHADYNTPTTENNTVQQSFNQTFVDAVRSTGGRNAYRNLIIQAYNTNIDHAVNFLKIATDQVSNRIMVEVHYYDPWDFCGDSGSGIYLWGAEFAQYGKVSTWGQESYVKTQFAKMKTSFVDKGYPVILGEYGAIRRSSITGDALTHHLDSRAFYYQYVTEQAKKYGMVPFYWDNGGTGANGFGLFNRSDGATFDQQALNGLITGAATGIYPF